MKRKMQAPKGGAKHTNVKGSQGKQVDIDEMYGPHANPKKPGADAKPKKALSKAKQKALANKII